MGTGKYAEHLRKKQIRFGRTHLGAKQRIGDAGGLGAYSYTAYDECSAAAALEMMSLAASVVLIGIAFVWLGTHGSLRNVLLALAAVLLFRHLTKWLIRLLNNRIVSRKIEADAEYAAYFALQYPEQTDLCRALNEVYAANPEAIPAEIIHAQITENRSRDAGTLRAIGYAGLGLLVLLAAAFIAFAVWAARALR